MIYLTKKLLFLTVLILFSKTLFASNSSSYLISQQAYKNHDYIKTLFDFNLKNSNFSRTTLMDKVIAAIITEDIELANDISNTLLDFEENNQEAYVVKLTYHYINNDLNKIRDLYDPKKNNNDLINFIFFNDNELRDNTTISKSLLDIVISSFSNAEQNTLNYNFLLFYTSLAKLIDPANDRATLIKGELFQNVNQYETARNIFQMIKPESVYFNEAQKSLALNYSIYLDYDKAEDKIKKLSSNNNYEIKNILADFYRINKKYEYALNIYNELIQESRNDVWKIFYLRGICYERQGKWDLAEKDFLKSLEIKPDTPNVLNYLAYGWVERNIKLDESLRMLKSAYDLNPDSYYIIDSLAWAYFKKNNLEKAAELMEKVIDIAPGEAISLDHLGDIYYAMDRKREAIHLWQQALELAEPEDEIKEDVLGKLENINAG
tara:strand:- start:116 stop:1420 length:1305 start_codon:yes stop_codon:yes gene_type:complete